MSTQDDDEGLGTPLPEGMPYYMTPQGHVIMREEVMQLLDIERPEITRLVNWAASNGDRSENADYQYGKKRLREIDRRIRFLSKRLERAEVIDPTKPANPEKAYFGSTVSYAQYDLAGNETENTVTIVGLDETNVAAGAVSYIAPIARVLLGKRVGDEAKLQTPKGLMDVLVLRITYPKLLA